MKRTAFILVALLILGSITAFAQKSPRFTPNGCDGSGRGIGPGKEHFRPGMFLKMADEIGLDDNQKTKISQLAETNGLKRIELKADLEKAQLKLRHLKMNEAADAEILNQMDDIGRMKTEMKKNAYMFRQSVESVLTEEQLEKAKELRKEHRGKKNFCPGRGSGGNKGHGQESVPGPETDFGYHGGHGW